MKFVLQPVSVAEDVKGQLIINADSDEANADWIRAARLLKAAEAGDKEAAKELARRLKSPMYEIVGVEEV